MLNRSILAVCAAAAATIAFPSHSNAFDWYSSDGIAWSEAYVQNYTELDYSGPTPGWFSKNHTGTLNYVSPPAALGTVITVTGTWVEQCGFNAIGGLASGGWSHTYTNDEEEYYEISYVDEDTKEVVPQMVMVPGLAFDFGTATGSKNVEQGWEGQITLFETELDPETWSVSLLGGGVATASWFVTTSGPTNPFGSGGGGGWDGGFTNGTVNASGAVAAFPSAGTGAVTIPTGGRTAGVLAFDSSAGYTFSGGPLIFRDDTAGRTRLSVAGSATHTVSSELDVRQDMYSHVVTGSAFNVTGTVTLTSGVKIVKTGLGSLGLNRFSSGDLLVQEGTVRSTASSGTAAKTGRLYMYGSGSTTAAAGVLDLAVAGAGMVIEVPTAAEADHQLSADARGSIRNLITNGCNVGTWTDSVSTALGAITSTAARTSGTHGIGYATSANLLGSTGGTFLGQTVDGSAILLKVVPYGDADMDGDVDSADQAILTANMNATGTSWLTGDFNYDGVTDADDQALFDANDSAF